MEGKSITLPWVNTIFFPILLATLSSPSRALFLELQNVKGTTRSQDTKTGYANLDCEFVENALYHNGPGF